MKSHSFSVTGVTERRLPRRKTTKSELDAWYLRSSSSAMRRLNLRTKLHVDDVPTGRIAFAVGIEVFALGVEGGLIGIAAFDDFDDAGDPGEGAAGVVEKRRSPFFIESRSMLRAW
jgi:hypothetical protein